MNFPMEERSSKIATANGNALEPGSLPLIPLNRSGHPEEVAGVVSFLCGPDSAYIQGQVLAVNGGLVM